MPRGSVGERGARPGSLDPLGWAAPCGHLFESAAERRDADLSGWKFPFALQAGRFSADEGHVRTPRGLLATLGATLSMVAAAACVLFFTSTLVAVNGWPGLSAPPNSGPVALAPVERALNPSRERSGEPAAPVVLGAPVRPTAPTPQVGVGAGTGAGTAPAGGPTRRTTRRSGGGERIGSEGSGPESTTPIVQTQTPAPQVQIGPIPVAPPAGAPVTIPVVQAPAAETQSTSPAPTDRRVTVSSPVEGVQNSWSDGQQAVAPQRPPAQRTLMRAPATKVQSWEEPAPQTGVDTSEQTPATDPCPPADKPEQQPAPTTDPASAPATAPKPEPATAPEPEPATAPQTATKPESDAGTQTPAATQPAPQQSEPQQSEPQQSEPQPPEPQPPEPQQPEPQQPAPCPPAEQAPAAQPAPAPQAPAPEQAPAAAPAPPC
jgi:hypothetical protein